MDTQPVLHSFAYAIDYLVELLADVPPQQMASQPGGIVNHPAWTIGHLAHTCEQLAAVLGVDAWLPADYALRFGTGSVPRADISVYEPKDAALQVLRDAQSRLTVAVEMQSVSDLAAPFPDPMYEDVFPSVGHALTQVMVGHTAFHVGQVTIWRRAMGLPRLIRGFE